MTLLTDSLLALGVLLSSTVVLVAAMHMTETLERNSERRRFREHERARIRDSKQISR
jgi:hypothetical protein